MNSEMLLTGWIRKKFILQPDVLRECQMEDRGHVYDCVQRVHTKGNR